MVIKKVKRIIKSKKSEAEKLFKEKKKLVRGKVIRLKEEAKKEPIFTALQAEFGKKGVRRMTLAQRTKAINLMRKERLKRVVLAKDPSKLSFSDRLFRQDLIDSLTLKQRKDLVKKFKMPSKKKKKKK